MYVTDFTVWTNYMSYASEQLCTTRRYAIVVYLSVCLSHSSIVSNWLNAGSRK